MTSTLTHGEDAARPAEATQRGVWVRRSRYGLAAATAGAAVVLPAISGPYLVTLAATALVLGVLAMSTQLLVGVAGLPSFGQVAYFGVGAYTAALLANAGIATGPVQLSAAVLAAGIAGALTAPIVLRTRGTAFLMVTVAVQALTAIAAVQWRTVTGGDEGLHTPAVTAWPGATAMTNPGYVYWYVLAAAALIGAVIAVLLRSRLALVLRGNAGHEPRMAALGHHVTAEYTLGYTIAAAIAGAGGALLITVNRYVSPGDIGFEAASLVLLAAAIGAGTMTGALAGAVAVIAARDLLGTSSGGLSPLLLGLLFLTVVYTRPAWTALRRRHAATARIRAGGTA